MNNVNRVVQSGLCTGCGACNVCDHITFVTGSLGFPVPRIDESCIRCGKCLTACLYDPMRDEDD